MTRKAWRWGSHQRTCLAGAEHRGPNGHLEQLEQKVFEKTKQKQKQERKRERNREREESLEKWINNSDIVIDQVKVSALERNRLDINPL